jgi:NAD-specific glutamate dehydrogenase
MEDDLYTIRREIIETVLEQAGGRPIDEAVDAFLEDRSAAYGRVQRFMRSLAMEGVTDLSQLTVALRQLRSLVS